METFWMCYVEDRDAPKHRHLTYESACAQAEKLAKLPNNIGQKVYILEALAVCETPVKVTWNELTVGSRLVEG